MLCNLPIFGTSRKADLDPTPGLLLRGQLIKIPMNDCRTVAGFMGVEHAK
jgi:hypothetical protein